MDCSSEGSSVHGIFKVRILDMGCISFSRGSSQPRDQICVSIVRQILSHWATREAWYFFWIFRLSINYRVFVFLTQVEHIFHFSKHFLFTFTSPLNPKTSICLAKLMLHPLQRNTGHQTQNKWMEVSQSVPGSTQGPASGYSPTPSSPEKVWFCLEPSE